MKLSKEQIAQIDENLVSKELIYDDIKLELTDHIASDIEEIMNNREVSFEIAFKEAFEKWEDQLKLQYGNWISSPSWKRGPKLFMDKWKEQSIKIVLFTALLTIIISLLDVVIFEIYKSDSIFQSVKKVYKSGYLITIVLLIIGRFLMMTSKIKTSFGNMFNVYFVFSVIVISKELFENRVFRYFPTSIADEFVSSFFVTFYPAYAISSFYLLCKHFQFERKLSKV